MIVYTDRDTKEIKIAGPVDEWKCLASIISAGSGAMKCQSMDNPKPYSGTAEKILIKHNAADKLVFNINCNGNLEISGSQIVCNEVSSVIRSFVIEYISGEHFHFDSLDSNLVASESADVVFSLT